MNEAQTRIDLIDPQLRKSGWGEIADSRILVEYPITDGKILAGGGRAKKYKADYVLVYKGVKLAVIEAKSDELEVGEGVAQAKRDAQKLDLDTTFAANGREIYQICMVSGNEGLIKSFPTPRELWNKTFPNENNWLDKFNAVPFDDLSGTKPPRFYQESAVNNVMKAIAQEQDRILLTLATGTGKTYIAFQIAWKLFHSRWNLKRGGGRRPRILFLADRNILANQAFNSFNAFDENALIRIKPNEIRKRNKVPTNGSIFFTIFQTFMSGTDAEGNPEPYFGEYPPDFFDFIVIDECHRGGANDESNWRGILEYFSPAVQLGLTATPKRDQNIDTYRYFGEPVYVYSLKEGINDGFLTPFKVKRIQTTLDEYTYTSDDTVEQGEIETGRLYGKRDFNLRIEIKEREAEMIRIFLEQSNPNEKSLVFGATQAHAALLRDLINRQKESTNINYCVRVTADEGEIGEQFLREFQDNEKTIPTILTTSQKLSTGVDARNIRNIVLLRPVNSMIEFKQIIGRGTRLFDGKNFFTIYDFVDAYRHFHDEEWDGEPLEPEPIESLPPGEREKPDSPETPEPRPEKIKVKLADGKDREIQHIVKNMFFDADGNPISAEEFLRNLFGKLPDLFKSEDELRKIWSNPMTRKTLLEKLTEAGYGREELEKIQEAINAKNSDLFDVLEFIAYAKKPITRLERVESAQNNIFALLNRRQKEFLEFVLLKYIEAGVDELDTEKLPDLLVNKYKTIQDAALNLGEAENIRSTFIDFQKHLYQQKAA